MANVELKGLRKSFGGHTVIDGIDLDIASGDFCVFVGPSGCGKSTLLRMISGLEPVSEGDIVIGGTVSTHVPASDRGLAMVFQSYALYPHMTVRQNLSFGLENIGMARAQIDDKVDQVARMLQISPLLARKPKDLSGGQRQRVAIGRAVVREPLIFLFDEPLSNLDAELRVEMRAEISALHRRLGNTMIYVTHDQIEAMTMADKIAVLRAGKLEQFGKPLDLYNRPANAFVAGFIGSPRMNFLQGRLVLGAAPLLRLVDGTTLALPQKGFALTDGQDVSLGIRPNHLRAAQDGALSVTVTGLEQHGAESSIFAKMTGQGGAITVQMPGQTTLRMGDSLKLDAPSGDIHLFDAQSGLSLRRD